jgi:hypothetical protein
MSEKLTARRAPLGQKGSVADMIVSFASLTVEAFAATAE